MSTAHIHDAAEILVADLKTIIESLDQQAIYSVYNRMQSVSALSLMINATMDRSAYEPLPAERMLIEDEGAFENYGFPMATVDDMELEPFEGF